jgi:hypothetical protein
MEFKESGEQEPKLITLPEDEYRVKQLWAKMEELNQRLAKQRTESPYLHPDQSESPRTRMEYEILAQLKNEEVVLYDEGLLNFLNRFKSRLEHFGEPRCHDEWDTAFFVVHDYCTTGGLNVGGGTGLPEIDSFKPEEFIPPKLNMRTKQEIPKTVELLRSYLEAERIDWNETKLGTNIIVEAVDAGKQDLSTFSFTVVDTKLNKKDKTTTTWVELDENDFTFFAGKKRIRTKLPQGTIMECGVNCTHFPSTTALMVYINGIACDRDYNFDHVMTPDGKVIGSVYVPGVTSLYSFLPESEYIKPERVEEYHKKIDELKKAEKAEQEDAEVTLDKQIDTFVHDLFSNEKTQQELLGIFSTFCTEGRYTLASLMLYARDNQNLDKFIPVVKKALDEEFGYSHPNVRGAQFMPASQRGFDMIANAVMQKYEK